MKKRVLGRGLDALIPDSDPRDDSLEKLKEIDLDLIDPNPVQPRTRGNYGDLDGLVASIKESGVIQPILVRKTGSRYQLIAGERRWTAAQRAGLLRIPAVVKEVPDNHLLEIALVENIQRQELTCIEEASAYRQLMDELKLTQEEVAAKVGKDRATVANMLRLLKLPDAIQDMIQEGKLAMGHARPLLSLESKIQQIKLAEEAIRHGLSARAVESKVNLLLKAVSGEQGGRKKKGNDANIAAAIEDLRKHLGTKVEMTGYKKKGKIILHYFSEDELERLFDQLMGR